MSSTSQTVRTGKPIAGVESLLSRFSTALKPLTHRFTGGVTLAEALNVAKKLSSEGFLISLNYLTEAASSEKEAESFARHCIIILKALKEAGLERNISLKLSRLGLSMNTDICRKNLEKIIHAAEDARGFVFVDTERSDATTEALDIAKQVWKNRRTPFGVALHAGPERSPDDLIGLLDREITVCLRGGTREENKDFTSIMKRLLTSGVYHCIATDDKDLIEKTLKFAREQKVSPNAFEFQMKMGIHPSLQRKLAADGWRVRIRIPFGREWFPYSLRQLKNLF